MNPLFFSSSDKQLFGIHHPPEGPEIRGGAVLICPPLGHEYIASHRPLQQLSVRLSRAGFHVLRFDFYGCGDSAGDMESASVEQWVRDVALAVQELKDTTGSNRLSVLGLRLGGSLAAMSLAGSLEDAGVHSHGLVLWEPVVSGAAYVAELMDVQREWVTTTYPKPRREYLDWGGPEVMGFALPDSVQQQLRQLDVLQLPVSPADNVLIVENIGNPALGQLQNHLAGLGDNVTLARVPSDKVWHGQSGEVMVTVPYDVVRRITDWMTEIYR